MIYFVDDNFIGNRKATREMLPHLIAWQKKHDYPLQFACEATLNIAKQTDILELMREAGFFTVFVGIETPELDALKHIAKDHNNAVPMMEAIQTLNELRAGGHLRHHPGARHRDATHPSAGSSTSSTARPCRC